MGSLQAGGGFEQFGFQGGVVVRAGVLDHAVEGAAWGQAGGGGGGVGAGGVEVGRGEGGCVVGDDAGAGFAWQAACDEREQQQGGAGHGDGAAAGEGLLLGGEEAAGGDDAHGPLFREAVAAGDEAFERGCVAVDDAPCGGAGDGVAEHREGPGGGVGHVAHRAGERRVQHQDSQGWDQNCTRGGTSSGLMPTRARLSMIQPLMA